MAERVKDRVRDHFERKIDKLHRIADVVTFPLAPIDGAIHGIARGVLNWVTDTHPEDRAKSPYTTNKCISLPQHCYSLPYQGYCPPQPSQYSNPNCYVPPPPPGPTGYRGYPPPQPPYRGYPSQPGPGYPYPPNSYYNTGGHANTGNGNNSSGQTNDGTLKFANVGSS